MIEPAGDPPGGDGLKDGRLKDGRLKDGRLKDGRLKDDRSEGDKLGDTNLAQATESVRSASGPQRQPRWRAPSQDRSALLDPALARVDSSIIRNRELLAARPELHSWVEVARHQLLESAYRYTRNYLPCRRPADSSAVIMAGHQPELIHPGVWFKNFALNQVARSASAAVAVNLLIDNDAVRKCSILVPHGSPDQARVLSLPYDQRAPRIPYEERSIADRRLFTAFGQRVQETLRGLIDEPLIEPYWEYARGANCENLGQVLARARHQVESDVGLQTLEVPLSHLCAQSGFLGFVSLLLAQAERWHRVYNACLRQFRGEHKIRSHSHPVPDLSQDGSWFELPLWIWSSDDPERKRVMVRRAGNHLELGDGASQNLRLSPLTNHGGSAAVEPWVEQLLAWQRAGVRLRPRALTTTMFARLLLSDLFIHGIGGAIYDQLTNRILSRLWDAEPPDLMVATATFRLPVPHETVTLDDLRQLNWQLRELRFHPERYAPNTSEVREILQRKLQWIHTHPPRGARAQRHRGIEEANQALRAHVDGSLPARWSTQRERLLARLRVSHVWDSREYAFCLFPQKTLSTQLLELLHTGA